MNEYKYTEFINRVYIKEKHTSRDNAKAANM